MAGIADFDHATVERTHMEYTGQRTCILVSTVKDFQNPVNVRLLVRLKLKATSAVCLITWLNGFKTSKLQGV